MSFAPSIDYKSFLAASMSFFLASFADPVEIKLAWLVFDEPKNKHRSIICSVTLLNCSMNQIHSFNERRQQRQHARISHRYNLLMAYILGVCNNFCIYLMRYFFQYWQCVAYSWRGAANVSLALCISHWCCVEYSSRLANNRKIRRNRNSQHTIIVHASATAVLVAAIVQLFCLLFAVRFWAKCEFVQGLTMAS